MSQKLHGIDHFPRPAPTTMAPAAYRLVVWIYSNDEGETYTAEAPQLGLKEQADHPRDAYNALAGKVAHLRNNGGKPKPLQVKGFDETSCPEHSEKRILAVS